MLIGHLPAGYLLARALRRGKLALWAGLIGSVFPDIDLLYSLLAGQQPQMHHSYWTHTPAFWLTLFVTTELGASLFSLARARPALRMFFAGVLLHLCLDTITGGIAWMAPMSFQELSLFDFGTQGGWHLAATMRHWTFGFELVILGGATVAALTSRNKRAGGMPKPTILPSRPRHRRLGRWVTYPGCDGPMRW